MFFCAPIIPHLVGKSYAESVSALRWLCLIPFFPLLSISVQAMRSPEQGTRKFRLVSQSIAAGGNLLLNLYLVPRYSLVGRRMGISGDRRSTRRHELASAVLSQQASNARPTDGRLSGLVIPRRRFACDKLRVK